MTNGNGTYPNQPTDDRISSVLRRLRLTAEIFQHAHYCQRWAVDTSGHRMAPFHLIQKGNCWLHLDGEEPRQLTPGDLVVLPHDKTHQIASSADTPSTEEVNRSAQADVEVADSIMLCGFFDFESKASWPLLDTLPSAVVVDHGTHRFDTLVQLIFDELSEPKVGSELILENAARGLFVFVIRAALDSGIREGVLSALADSRLGPALQIIHEDPAADISVERLSTAANLSRSAFAERFRDALGVAPMRYLQQWRLQIALDLLVTSSATVAAVAEQVGYASEVSFRQAFRKELGMTPSQARQGLTAG